MCNYFKFNSTAWEILEATFKPSEIDNALYSFATNQWTCKALDNLKEVYRGFNHDDYKAFLEDYYKEVIGG